MGGVETYTAELSRYLAGQGHQVTIFCRESDFLRPDYTLTTEIIDQVKILRLVNDYKHSQSFRRTIVDSRLEQIFSDLLAAEQPDLIHFNHLIALSARLPLLASAQKIPAVIMLHDFWNICHRVNLIDWRGRICPGPLHDVNCAVCVVGGSLRQKSSQAIGSAIQQAEKIFNPRRRSLKESNLLEIEDPPPALASFPKIFQNRLALFTEAILSAQRILAPSEFVRSQFARNGIPYERIEVFPLGIETQPAPEVTESAAGVLTLAVIGPLQPIKGVDIAINAFRRVPGEHLRLKIFGRTDLYPQDYARRVTSLAQTDARISLMGPFNPAERSTVYASMDVLIVPSRAPETFSFVTREALALGKPVIASQIGALPEVIQNGINGFLFPPGDTHALAQHITAFANDPDLIQRLTIPGPANILNTIEHGTQMETIYHQILDNQ